MYTFLHRKFTFAAHQYINRHQCIAVALSGGQDSLCLIKLLNDCINKKKQTIRLVYIDHQWKSNSKKHVQHIANIGNLTGLPVTIYQVSDLAISENKARALRYRIIIQDALEKNCDAIITGHNNDDRIETLIGNLFRGTGLSGITNFTIYKQISRQLSILRPLINFSKAEIGWLCRLFYLPTWSDDTNYNLKLKRNKIRHELVPYIQNFFNPQIKKMLKNLSQVCTADNEYIKENTIKLYVKSAHIKLVGINLCCIRKQHHVLQERVVRLYFYYHFNKQISSQAIISILKPKKKLGFMKFNIDQLDLYLSNSWLYTAPQKNNKRN